MLCSGAFQFKVLKVFVASNLHRSVLEVEICGVYCCRLLSGTYIVCSYKRQLLVTEATPSYIVQVYHAMLWRKSVEAFKDASICGIYVYTTEGPSDFEIHTVNGIKLGLRWR